jgi:hypothetical protein
METCVENFNGAVLKALVAYTPNIASVMNQGLRIRPAFRNKTGETTGCEGSGRSSGNPLWKLRSPFCKRR